VTLLVGLAVAALAVAAAGIARRSRVPPPVYLVLAGLVVSFVPRVERFHLPPQVVFYGFLPPLVYAAAFVTAPREARANWRFILVLAFGLTAATLFAVPQYASFSVATVMAPKVAAAARASRTAVIWSLRPPRPEPRHAPRGRSRP